MKCLKCGMEVKENNTICPFCGSSIENVKAITETTSVELPVLKAKVKKDTTSEKDTDMLNSLAQKFDKDDVSLEKTRTIKPVEDKEEFSLLNDINKQIETVNEEAKAETVTQEVKSTGEEEKKEEESLSLDTKTSVNKRTKVLLATVGIVLVLAIAIAFTISAMAGSRKAQTSDIEEKLDQALQVYYDSGKTEEITDMLDEYKSNETIIETIHDKIKDKSLEWLDTYFETEYVSQAEFNSQTTRYKDLYRGLFEYAIIKDGSSYIRALDSGDYDELTKRIDDNYVDSRIFYEAIDLYNNKDYNKAYYALNQVSNNSAIYTKTRIYVDRINSNVLGLLKADIAKIEQDTTNLSDSDILKMYSQIEQIIIDYDRLYSNLELDKNKDYSDLLQEYKTKVASYSN